MNSILFSSEADVTDQWAAYIHQEALALASRDEFSIQNYMDREINNPLMSELAQNDDVEALAHFNDHLQLNFHQEKLALHLPNWLKIGYNKLKNKVKKVFCEVVTSLKDLDMNGIIKAVLLALIPAFATGFPAAVLPIVIGLVAYLLKYGYDKTCPA